MSKEVKTVSVHVTQRRQQEKTSLDRFYHLVRSQNPMIRKEKARNLLRRLTSIRD